MRATSKRTTASWCAVGLVATGLCACSVADDPEDPNPMGQAGSSSPGTAGASALGGTAPVAGSASAGTPASSGSSSTAGVAGVAGAPAGGAGAGTSAGGGGSGSMVAGNGGMSMGGRGGATSGGGSTGGGSSGGSGSGTCVKGQTKGADVAVIGESFIALSHGITQEIEKQAKAAGSLGQSEHYVDNSVSGTTLANNQIPSQYTKAAMSGKIKYVLMDGGGNDCLLNNNGNAALTAAEALFKTMGEKGTEKVLYFFYPDPIGANYNDLKSCLDTLRPKMKALCDGLTAPKCYWLDLRPTWNGHNDYTSDGIHPTAAGSVATGDVIWEAMKTNCVAQ